MDCVIDNDFYFLTSSDKKDPFFNILVFSLFRRRIDGGLDRCHPIMNKRVI